MNTICDPNPLNYFGLRRVNYAPPHFFYYTIQKSGNSIINSLSTWIENNLQYRYYINQVLTLNKNKVIVYGVKIGFEYESELGYFVLTCPHLYKEKINE